MTQYLTVPSPAAAEYIKALIPIKHHELSNALDTPASDELLSLYRSLLGAAAYTQLTQHQMACYIVALQRVTHKLTIEDVKKLNVITKKVKESPVTLVFRPLGNLDESEHLTIFSDAGFKKEEIDGYALRGGLYVRHAKPVYKPDGTPVGNSIDCHVILAESRSIKTVCRSTYAAELMSATSATDMLIPLSVTLHEIRSGPLGIENLRKIRDVGWTHAKVIQTRIVIDAKSVYESLKASIFKPPVENSLAGHVLWLREMHYKGLVNDIVWTDARDMYADGLTKGVIKRDALFEVMAGTLRLRHTVAVCTRRFKATHAHHGTHAHANNETSETMHFCHFVDVPETFEVHTSQLARTKNPWICTQGPPFAAMASSSGQQVTPGTQGTPVPQVTVEIEDVPVSNVESIHAMVETFRNSMGTFVTDEAVMQSMIADYVKSKIGRAHV